MRKTSEKKVFSHQLPELQPLDFMREACLANSGIKRNGSNEAFDVALNCWRKYNLLIGMNLSCCYLHKQDNRK